MDLKETQRHWDELGRKDPYWAVLTTPGKQGGGWEEGAFFATGRAQVAALVDEADSLVAQNDKFEAGWLLRLGYDPTEKTWWDTMLAERVKAGNRPWRLGLGHMAPRYGFAGKESRVETQMKMGVCPSLIDPRYLRARCRRDTATTGSIFAVQQTEARAEGWEAVVRTRCMLTPILAVIEANGMCLDPARVEEEYVKARTQRATLDSELTAIAGGMNLKSVKQKAALFYDTLNLPERTDKKGLPVRSGKGERKTDKATVAWLQTQAKTPEQKAFFATLGEHAKVSALLLMTHSSLSSPSHPTLSTPPWASVSTSPVPALANAALPVGLMHEGASGAAMTLPEPFNSTAAPVSAAWSE
jgi:DNA polymerase I-like protein with 3'-5' exonuclease and polymerase domains